MNVKSGVHNGQSTVKTCGQCGHWSRPTGASGSKNPRGMCCKDVPFWAYRAEDGPRWAVSENEESAENCDCFSKKD